MLLIALQTPLLADQPTRPSEWAQPLRLDGVPNLHQVAPGIYRSAQPNLTGMRNVAKALGIKTVINLRNFHSDLPMTERVGVELHELNINTWSVRDRDIVRVLQILRRQDNGPFLIHCQHGADRTGLMIAVYRMVEQGWSREAAMAEMLRGGYGFHHTWKNIIRYLEQVDPAKIEAQITRND